MAALTELQPITMPREPVLLHELGVTPGTVRDLAIKAMFYRGLFTRLELAEALWIAMPAVEEVLQTLTRHCLATVLTAETADVSGYSYTLTQQGQHRGEEALGATAMSDPCPWPSPTTLRSYTRKASCVLICPAK